MRKIPKKKMNFLKKKNSKMFKIKMNRIYFKKQKNKLKKNKD